MRINNTLTQFLRSTSCSGKLIETDRLLMLHAKQAIHVVATPEVLQADPLFRKFYTGRRRSTGRDGSKEAPCKDGTVHLSIGAITALRADDDFTRFMDGLRALAHRTLP